MSAPVSEHELHAFADGLLPPCRRDEVARWLQQHPDAATRVADYQRLNQELRAAYPLPSDHWQPALQRRRSPWLNVAAFVATLLVGAALGWQGRGLAPLQETARVADLNTLLVTPARVSHRVYTPEVLHPVEVRKEQQQHLVGWLSKRMGKQLQAPDLGSRGFELMGGRLLPASDGPAAQFMYENSAGQRLTLYIREADGKQDQTAFRRYSEQGLSSFYWIDNGLGYALTGDIPADQLMLSAQQVYHQLSF